MIVFGIFSSNPLNLMLYLTLIPKGIGGEIAPLSFCKPKKVLIETFKVFFYDCRILSVTLHEKNLIGKT